MPTLATLVTNSSLRSTFGESLVPCHRVTSDWIKGQQKKRYCEFRVRGSRVHRHSACGVARPYWQLYSGMLAGAAARAASAGSPLPDAELCVFEGCRSREADRGTLLQWCLADPAKLALPSPYESNCIYKHRYAATLEHNRRLLAAQPALAPWDARRPLAVWRGSLTGLGALGWFKGRGKQPSQRTRLAILGRSNPELLDAGLYPSARMRDAYNARTDLFATVDDALSDADYGRFQYIVDLDGDGCSGRLAKLLDLGSVVLRPVWGSIGRPFYWRLLEPWTHYVPLQANLSDLVPTITWLREHPARARRIAAAGKAFAAEHFAPAAIDAYVAALIRGIASLRRPNAKLSKGKFTPLEYDAKGYRSPKGLVDQKGRKLDVHCPASTAPKAMLPIDSAAALARGYYEAAGVDHPPSKESVAAAAEQARLKNAIDEAEAKVRALKEELRRASKRASKRT